MDKSLQDSYNPFIQEVKKTRGSVRCSMNNLAPNTNDPKNILFGKKTGSTTPQKPAAKLILDFCQNNYFLWIAFMTLAGGFLFFKNMTPRADESIHFEQIISILQGNPFPNSCPYLPGYYWTIAFFAHFFHNFDGSALRLWTTILSFFCLTTFFFLAKEIDKPAANQKSLTFLFFPILCPFFLLLYTDVYSMMFVLLSLFFALKRHLWLSGIFGILSLIVRQDNIIWLAFIAGLAYFESYYPEYRWQDIKRWLPKFSVFFLAAILFVAFVLWNKGLVVGDRQDHPFTLSCGNFFFTPFLFFFLFLPMNLANGRKILSFLKRYKIMIPILIELFLVYLFFFEVRHPFNRLGRWIHNLLLMQMDKNLLNQTLSFLVIAYSILSICVTPLRRKSFYLLYPCSILFLLLHPVIEVRYTFIIFSLFILFKEKESERITLFTLATYVVPLLCLLISILDNSFFP